MGGRIRDHACHALGVALSFIAAVAACGSAPPGATPIRLIDRLGAGTVARAVDDAVAPIESTEWRLDGDGTVPPTSEE